VSEVDEFNDAVDERISKRDERDDGPIGDPDKELRDKLSRVFDRLDE
jgi:hypothetical protein